MMQQYDDTALAGLAKEVGQAIRSRQIMLATAESCTGGWVAKLITDIPGSSHWFDRGFVTYTNQSKQEMLGVPAELLATHGAVSEQTVQAMALGALRNSAARLTLSISGIAGPGGGSAEKPVGLVWFGWAMRRDGAEEPRSWTAHHIFDGDRDAVRRQAVATSLRGVLEAL